MGEYIKIDSSNIHLLKHFLISAESALVSFRYFNTRPLSIIKNHIYTCLFVENREPTAYGHLDEEDGIVWLGIAVVAGKTGRGYGKGMMKQLIDVAKENEISEIHLSVDTSNSNAINLYCKFGFEHIRTKGPTDFYRLFL